MSSGSMCALLFALRTQRDMSPRPVRASCFHYTRWGRYGRSSCGLRILVGEVLHLLEEVRDHHAYVNVDERYDQRIRLRRHFGSDDAANDHQNDGDERK